MFQFLFRLLGLLSRSLHLCSPPEPPPQRDDLAAQRLIIPEQASPHHRPCAPPAAARLRRSDSSTAANRSSGLLWSRPASKTQPSSRQSRAPPVGLLKLRHCDAIVVLRLRECSHILHHLLALTGQL